MSSLGILANSELVRSLLGGRSESAGSSAGHAVVLLVVVGLVKKG